jgi:hypothetical protein
VPAVAELRVVDELERVERGQAEQREVVRDEGARRRLRVLALHSCGEEAVVADQRLGRPEIIPARSRAQLPGDVALEGGRLDRPLAYVDVGVALPV